MRVTQEVASLGLSSDVTELLGQHQVLLVVGHSLCELAAGGQTVAEVEEGARLARCIF